MFFVCVNFGVTFGVSFSVICNISFGVLDLYLTPHSRTTYICLFCTILLAGQTSLYILFPVFLLYQSDLFLYNFTPSLLILHLVY